jgi:anaerobic magnesium-protoporphyrin IX monomethyl ester cyclase
VLSQVLDRDEPGQTTFAPPGLGHLVSFASARMDGLEFSYAEGADEILRAEPDVVGVSAVSENFDAARKLAADLRKSFDGPMFLGGIHVSALPGSLPDEFDAGVIGEGEMVFLQLLRAIATHGNRWRDSLETIPGLCYRSGGRMVYTSRSEPFEELDALPYPDQSFLGNRWTMRDQGVQLVLTSRGCPYDCSFCSSSHFWHRVRYFSAEYVLAELSHLVEEYSPTSILFGDDLFISNRKRLSAISEGVKSLGIDGDVSFLCTVRSNEVDEELCDTLARMNVRCVALGLESGSDHVLELMNKRTTVRQHDEALRMLHDYGFNVYTSFILGAPGETLDDIKLTVDFIEKYQRKYFEFEIFPMIPYPGTRVWDYAVSRNLVNEDVPSDIFKLGSTGFDPDRYICLNETVPRDTFLYYYFYLKYMSYRNRVHRGANGEQDIYYPDRVYPGKPGIRELLEECTQARDNFLGTYKQLEEANAEIERRGLEIEKATGYVGSLEEHIKEITGYVRDLEEVAGSTHAAGSDSSVPLQPARARYHLAQGRLRRTARRVASFVRQRFAR